MTPDLKAKILAGAPCKSCGKDPEGIHYVPEWQQWPAIECVYCGTRYRVQDGIAAQDDSIPMHPAEPWKPKPPKQSPPKPPRKPDADRLAHLAMLPAGENDTANGDRLVALHGHEFRHVPQWGFMVWDGRRWKRDTEGRMLEFAKDTIVNFRIAAAALSHDDETELRKRLTRFAERCLNMGRLTAMIEAAKTRPKVVVEHELFNTHDDLLTVRNGVLNLTTGELLPHDPNLYLTGLADVEYDAKAQCPLWMKFIDWCFHGDKSLVAFTQRAFGYTLTGHTSDHCMFFLWGRGRNGKSTVLKVLNRLAGDYATTLGVDTLLSGKDNSKMQQAAAGLVNARFVFAVEAGPERSWNEQLIKLWTGGEARLKGEFKFKDSFDFLPRFKIWVAANGYPRVRGTDDAIWTRFRPMLFGNRVSDQDRDKDLDRKLFAELPGILAWAVRGAIEWKKLGDLRPPPAVTEALQAYRKDNDIIGNWIKDYCLVEAGRGYQAGAKTLLVRLNDHLRDVGEREVTPQALGRYLTEYDPAIVKRGKDGDGLSCWHGIALKANVPAQASLAQSDRIGVVHAVVRELARMHKAPVPEKAIVDECAGGDRPLPDAEVLRCLVELLRVGKLLQPNGAGSYLPATSSNADGNTAVLA